MDTPTILFLLNLTSTWFMVGLIWMVQVVHYPLFKDVGSEQFADYQNKHQLRISFIVGPVMLIEAFSTVLMAFYPSNFGLTNVAIGIVLLFAIWISTAVLQVPCHGKLSHDFETKAHKRLVNTNWIRTIAWTGRGVLVAIILAHLLQKS